jgi:uncharacterized protein (DUF1778 family)
MRLRLAPGDHEMLCRAAAATGQTVSEFLIESGRERAAHMVANRERFALADAEWKCFAAALDSPARANPAVAALFRRRRPE